MDVKMKLVELIQIGTAGSPSYLAGILADHLIANGVTIPVRCKDCKKRYNPKECPMCVFVYGEQHDVTHDDGYCDRGERRSDEETG